MKISYSDRKPRADRARRITQVNEILEDYSARGYTLTVRQLYYQLVSRDLIANTPKSYKQVVDLLTEARLAGLVDWDHIEDRTRGLHSLSTWASPAEIVRACADGYRLDLWADQPWRLELWVEKEALAGVFERVCDEWRIPLLSCRGYTSISEVHVAALRLRRLMRTSHVRIIHFGDHDPSGIDMSRDIQDRLATFHCRPDFRRVALTMEQVEEYGPPPNPAKTTDSRYARYEEEYGQESWELDALDPDVLAGLVRDQVEEVLDRDLWTRAQTREGWDRVTLQAVADHWGEITDRLGDSQ